MSADRKQSNIAIIGMACRLPGAEDYRQFWQNLCDGVKSVTFFSDEELLAAGVPAETLRDPSYVKAGFVVPGVDRFDAEFFEVSLRKRASWTRSTACCWKWPGKLSRMRAVVRFRTAERGRRGRDRRRRHQLPAERAERTAESRGRTANLVHLGNDKDFSSTRLSYKFNLTGPSINVQTACSTSLVALHLACQTIRSGECSMAMTAVATLRVPEVSGYQGQQGSIYSPDGHIRTFDADSKGTVFGSAVAAILLKDYDQAVADGDFIHAVIKGTAVNNDGSDKASYSASSVAGQAGAMLEALKMANASPDSIGYVECHGTGTVVGDPTEIHALTHAFRKTTDRVDFCPVGSVKPNIGHPEQAAGLASLIKAVEAIKHRQIPPTINLRTLNPKIQFAGSPFHVQTQLGAWPDNGGPRRALVNSLGIGGTNGVVILEEAPVVERGKVEAERPLHVAVFSAKSEQALIDLFDRHRQWLEANPDANLGDVCHTLAAGRAHFTYRAAVTAGSVAELRDTLALGLPTSRVAANRKIGFLFSGQGSQFAGMARDLYATQPVFRSALDRCAAALRPHLDTDLLEILLATDEKAELINQTAYTQPGLFAVEVSVAELLASWGIRPDAVVGTASASSPPPTSPGSTPLRKPPS